MLFQDRSYLLKKIEERLRASGASRPFSNRSNEISKEPKIDAEIVKLIEASEKN